MAFRMKWFPIVFISLAGCTYGPEQERARIENVAGKPGSYQFAVAVHYERFRPPTGLSSFPDGGKVKIIEQTAIIYKVDVGNREVVEIVHFDVPESLQSGFGVHVNGWSGNSVVFTLSGCAGPECHGDLRRRRHFEASPDHPLRELDEIPRSLEKLPRMLARAPGETHYMRISHGTREIRFRTVENASFEAGYRLGDTGRLTGIGDKSCCPGVD